MLRIVFMGSDPIALPLLEWIGGEGAETGRVVGVFTQPDRPAGRGQRATANPIKAWAQARGIPVLQPERLRAEALSALAALTPDLSLVLAYGHILGDDFIAAPRLGTVNLHASLLPRYRGASPIQSAIAGGERETGVGLMRMVRELDAGPVADVERVSIGVLDTSAEVEARLATACVPLLARSLPKLAAGSLVFEPQDAASATFCRRLTKADGVLDCFEGAGVLAARINALHPWPGCHIAISGVNVKLGLARAEGAEEFGAPSGAGAGRQESGGEEADRTAHARVAEPAGASPLRPFPLPLDVARGTGGVTPGTVLAGGGEGLRVATGNGVLRILKLQRPGGRMLSAGEFLRGFPIPPGTLLPSVKMPPLVSDRPFKH